MKENFGQEPRDSDEERLRRFGKLLPIITDSDDARAESALNEALALIEGMQDTGPLREAIYAIRGDRVAHDFFHGIYRMLRPRLRNDDRVREKVLQAPASQRLSDLLGALYEYEKRRHPITE